MRRFSLAPVGLLMALLSGCADPASIEPIEGRTFIVEERPRQEVWDAARAALEAEGRIETEDFQIGEMRGYAGQGMGYSAVLISLNQLYAGEDVYTVSVAGEAMAPLGDAGPVRDSLIEKMLEQLAI